MDDMTLDLTPRGTASIEALVNGPIQTNSYAVISNDECLIVDPAWEGERLVEHIRTAHPEVRVLGSVCTHGHADHVGGVAGVRAVVGDSALYELCAKDVTVPRANIEEQRTMWGIETPDPGEPTRLLAEGDTIEVGDVCRPHRGYTHQRQIRQTPSQTQPPAASLGSAASRQAQFPSDRAW